MSERERGRGNERGWARERERRRGRERGREKGTYHIINRQSNRHRKGCEGGHSKGSTPERESTNQIDINLVRQREREREIERGR